MKKSEAIEVVAVLIAAWGAREFPEERARIYEEMIQDLDFATARAAVRRLLTTARFVPAIAEIREAAIGAALGPRRTGLEAWGIVCEAMRKMGIYGTPRFKDPLITEALKLWPSWRDACNAPDEASARLRFSELYDTLAARARTAAVAGETPRAAPRELEFTDARPIPAPLSHSGRVLDIGGHVGSSGIEKTNPGANGEDCANRPVVPKRLPQATEWQRRVSSEELDAELARSAHHA